MPRLRGLRRRGAALAQTLPGPPRVISLDPTTYGETVGDVRTIAQATDAKDAALDLIARTARRADVVRLAVRGAPRPRVAALEWMDPVFVAGHWTPQLIEMAGGEDVLGFAGEPSRQATWEEVAAAQPEVVIVMPCGYDAARALVEAEELRRPAAHARRRPASSRSTRRRTSRGRGRASSTASSCSRTSCIPTACRRRRPRRWRWSCERACPPVPAPSCTCTRRRGATAPTASLRCSRAASIARATGRSSCSRWTASCATTSRRPASRCSCARWRCCGARRCRPRAGADRRGAGARRRRPRAAGPRARRRARAHEHVGDARRRRRGADRADPARLARARDLRRLRALLAGVPAAAAERRRAAVRVAGDARPARRDARARVLHDGLALAPARPSGRRRAPR